MNQQLPKEELIRSKTDFQKLIDQNSVWQGSFFRCHFLFGEDRKVGFSIPKRLGNAVQRNRMKRLLKENYRLVRHQIKNSQLLLVAKPAMKHASFWDIQKEYNRLLQFARM